MKNIITQLLIFIFFMLGIFTVNAQMANYKVKAKAPNRVSKPKPIFENVSIYRLQLKFKTGILKNAGSDSPVYIMMNDEDSPYYLNLSKNDREKGQTDVYDILSTSISKIKDIRKLTIGISDDDAWNINQVEILINDVVIFKKVFKGKEGWIDQYNKKYKSSISIQSKELRSSPYWTYNTRTKYIYMAPTTIPIKMIKAQMESLAGNCMKYMCCFNWGKKYGKEYVTVKKVDDYTVHVDLDLKQSGFMNLKDSEIDVDFDIKFVFVNGSLKASVKNIQVEYFDYGHLKTYKDEVKDILYGLSRPRSFESKIGLRYIEKFYDFDFTYQRNTRSNDSCGNGVKVLSNGDVCLGSKRGISDRRNNVE